MSHATFYQFVFFCSHQKKLIVNKVNSILKQCLQLVSIHTIFSCMQQLHIQRKITKKFNFELLCLFKSFTPFSFSCVLRRAEGYFFFFMTVMFEVTIEAPNITILKCSSLFDTYILIENLLLIVLYNIYGIALQRSSSHVAYFPPAIWSCNTLSVTDTNLPIFNFKHCFNIVLVLFVSNSNKAVSLSSSTTRTGNSQLAPLKNAVASSVPSLRNV